MLVWQDFLFACAAYPEEEPLRGEVIAEARDNVARLMPHASLAMWNGCNENIWGYQDWDWKEVDRRPHLGARLLPRHPSEHRRRGGSGSLLLPGQPVFGHDGRSIRTRMTMGCGTSGTSGTIATIPSTRDYIAALRRRVRIPGAAENGHPLPLHQRAAADAGLARACCTTRRPSTAI